jgi:hypothetical protein
LSSSSPLCPVVCETFLLIARSKTIEDQHQQLFQNTTSAMHIPSGRGFGAANLRLPQSNKGML